MYRLSVLVGLGCLRVDVLGHAVILAVVAAHEALGVLPSGHEVLDERAHVGELRIGERLGVDVHSCRRFGALGVLCRFIGLGGDRLHLMPKRLDGGGRGAIHDLYREHADRAGFLDDFDAGDGVAGKGLHLAAIVIRDREKLAVQRGHVLHGCFRQLEPGVVLRGRVAGESDPV